METMTITEEYILTLLREKRFGELRQILSDLNPVDIAALLGEVPEEKPAPALSDSAERACCGYICRDGQ